MKTLPILLFVLLGLPGLLVSQTFDPNYDESKIPDYTLPDPLVFADGSPVKTTKDWARRRAEILELFAMEVYGVSPDWKGDMEIAEISRDEQAVDGKAIQRELKLTLKNTGKEVDFYVLTYLPKSELPVPLFLGLNFYGNHTLTKDESILVTDSWIRNNDIMEITANRATEASRGKRSSNWPVEEIISRGYGLATMYYGDFDPDFDDGFENGVHGLMNSDRDSSSWGSIAAWAWGLSRVMDYLETDPGVDAKKVAVLGHSRLGKAALWAGAVDQRFAMVIANNSGCGGVALSRRKFGETVGRINTAFPHWFSGNFSKYNDREEELPIDQHQLLALLAPRPVYAASGEEDLWADPKGEFLATVAVSPVYGLWGKEGIPTNEMPEVNQPVMGNIGYHIRSGGHGLTHYDWMQYLDFAEMHFGQGK